MSAYFKKDAFYAPIFKILEDYLISIYKNKEEIKLLDFGCGSGYDSLAFKKLGFDVVGLDGSSKNIEYAKENYENIQFIEHFFTDRLPFEENSIDIIFSCSSLQYIEHEPFFSECKRVLTENGQLILLENLKNNPVTRIGRAIFKLNKNKYEFTLGII